jgi:hypothetical protein
MEKRDLGKNGKEKGRLVKALKRIGYKTKNGREKEIENLTVREKKLRTEEIRKI